MAKQYNMYSNGKDEVIYASSTDTISAQDKMLVRRTLPRKRNRGGVVETTPLRVNHTFVHDFGDQTVVCSVSTTVPPGVDTTSVVSELKDIFSSMGDEIAARSVTGDIIRNL